MTNGIRLPVGLLVLTGCLGPLLADDTQVYQLEPSLVVTPSRSVEPITDALAAVSVLTRADIERSAAEDLPELLRLQAGVDVVRTGGPGSQVSVFLRGGNSNHVLVLIDGVRAASSNSGAYAWEHLPLNQVERIEVVRGPRGSLYGSDAIGGVIHVFTRDDPAPYARVTAGSYGTASFEGGAGRLGPGSAISINAGYRDVDGFSAQNPNGFDYDPDDDGFEAVNLGIKGSLSTAPGEWRYSLLALNSETEFDQGVSEAEQRFGSLGFDSRFADAWTYQLQLGYSAEDLASDFGFYRTGFETRRTQFSWQNEYDSGPRSSMSFGLDYYTETGSSRNAWNERRHDTGLFAAWAFRPGRWRLQAAGRFDDNSRFGSEATGQLAAGFSPGGGWEVSGSFGSAFRGPNLNEQYSPGFGGLFAGNPDLEPESSTSAELGVRWRHASGGVSAFVHRTDVDDLIAFSGENFRAINIDTARVEGLELAGDWRRGGWNLEANVTLQSAEDRTTGNPLLRRPERKGSVTLDYRFDNGSWLGLEWFHSGSRSDFGGITLAAYDLVNLRAGWRFAPAWRTELRGENLADADYEPAYGFNAPGRSFFISLSWLP
ncbi:MAG: TonB-dependent receptor [Xanthomonadales bacterium]